MTKEISVAEMRNNIGLVLEDVNYNNSVYSLRKRGKEYAVIVSRNYLNKLQSKTKASKKKEEDSWLKELDAKLAKRYRSISNETQEVLDLVKKNRSKTKKPIDIQEIMDEQREKNYGY